MQTASPDGKKTGIGSDLIATLGACTRRDASRVQRRSFQSDQYEKANPTTIEPTTGRPKTTAEVTQSSAADQFRACSSDPSARAATALAINPSNAPIHTPGNVGRTPRCQRREITQETPPHQIPI